MAERKSHVNFFGKSKRELGRMVHTLKSLFYHKPLLLGRVFPLNGVIFNR